jgi:MFS family permease
MLQSCGPLLGPIIGGAIAQGLGWRSTQWFLAVYGGMTLVFLVFALPETLRQKEAVVDAIENVEQQAARCSEKSTEDVESQSITPSRPSATLRRTTTRQSVAQNSKKYLVFLRRAFLDPLKIILLLRYPVVAVTIYYAAITFGSLYVLNISIEDTFSKPPYNFETSIVGLMYIPGSLGYLIASLFGGRWLDHIMKREAMKAGRYDTNGNLIFRPEDRMRENAWAAAFAFPIALIWYGWTAEKGVYWIVPVYVDC